jgi:hypothetical protein
MKSVLCLINMQQNNAIASIAPYHQVRAHVRMFGEHNHVMGEEYVAHARDKTNQHKYTFSSSKSHRDPSVLPVYSLQVDVERV